MMRHPRVGGGGPLDCRSVVVIRNHLSFGDRGKSVCLDGWHNEELNIATQPSGAWITERDRTCDLSDPNSFSEITQNHDQ